MESRRRVEEDGFLVGFLLILAAAVVVVILSALPGCVPSSAVKQARIESAVNLGHSRDATLSPDARLIAQDNYDAWSVQLFSLTGEPVPTDVDARVRARKAGVPEIR